MSDNLQRKTLTLEIKDAEKGQVEAVFATFDVIDKHGDWTEPDAFDDGAEVLIGAWGHATVFGEPPVGKGVIKVTKKDARLVGQYFLDTQAGAEQFKTVRNVGPKQEWSYSFEVKGTGEVTDEMHQRGVRRVLSKMLVHEVSPVMRGAGINTRTVSAKCAACGHDAGNLAQDDQPATPPAPKAEEKPAEKPGEKPADSTPIPADDAAKRRQQEEIDAEVKRFERTGRQLGL